MEREDVRIALDDKQVRVHATFWFRNRGPATTVWMGFPDETIDQNSSTRTPIRSFRSRVDGKFVKVRHQKLRKGYKKDWELKIYRSAWVKTVRFPRDGARKVEVWYTADHGFAGEGWAFDTYVFRTGATWRGTIGRIEATVDWTKMRERSRPALRLTGPAPGARWTRLGYRKERLVVENVKPKFDLNLTTVGGFWNLRLNDRTLEQNLALPVDYVGRVLTGPPNDLRVSVEGLGRIFGRYQEDEGIIDWASPVSARFGKELSLVGKQTLIDGKGRKFLLARPATDDLGKPLNGKQEAPYVRLKDVFRALGGNYVYVPREERVDLRLSK